MNLAPGSSGTGRRRAPCRLCRHLCADARFLEQPEARHTGSARRNDACARRAARGRSLVSLQLPLLREGVLRVPGRLRDDSGSSACGHTREQRAWAHVQRGSPGWQRGAVRVRAHRRRLGRAHFALYVHGVVGGLQLHPLSLRHMRATWGWACNQSRVARCKGHSSHGSRAQV